MINLHAKDIENITLDNPLYYLDGADLYWRDKTVAFFKSLVSGDFFDLNFKVVEASLSELDSACQALPILSDRVVVFVRSLSGNAKEADISVASKALNNISEGVTVLLEDDALMDTLTKKKAVKIDCNKLSEKDCFYFVGNIAKELDVSLTAMQKSNLISYNNCDLMKIKNEIIKLRDFSGNVINDLDFNQLAIPDNEHQAYEFTNAIAAKNKAFALSLLSDMRARGIAPSYILAMLSNQYRKMLHSVLSTASESDIMKALNITSSYAFSKTKEVAEKYKKTELKNIVEMLNEMEFRFKSGELINEASALEIAIGELINI